MLCEIHTWNNLLRRYLYGGGRDTDVTSLSLVKNLNIHNWPLFPESTGHHAPAWTWHTKILEAPCPSEWSHLFNWNVQKQVNLELGSWSLNLGLSCCCSVDWTILVELCLLHLGLASWMHPPLLYQKQTSETLALQGWQLHQFSTSAPCVPPSCTLLLLSKSALLPSTSRQPGNCVL